MENILVIGGLALILEIVLLVDIIKAWRQHRLIFLNGTPCMGKIMGYQPAYPTAFGRHGWYETAVVEFTHLGVKRSRQLMKNYFSQPNKIYADIWVCYWPELPDKLIAYDAFYWVRYLLDTLFLSAGFLLVLAAIFL